MKKILLINASHQNAACLNILENIQQKFWLEYSTEIVSLRDYDINQCLGCTECFKNGECVIEDKFHLVREKMEDSDFIVVCTPTYFYNVSGTLKTTIDRTRAMLKTNSLNNKKFVFIYCTYHNLDTVKSFLDTALQGFNHSHHINNLGAYSVGINENLEILDPSHTQSIIEKITTIINDNI
ncbi:MAG: flavodoxin family protein [Clostridia bacterium]|nr:flavodoxin family protein [Clostridia bacterium]